MGFWQEVLWGLHNLLFPHAGQCPLCRGDLQQGEVVCPACCGLLVKWRELYSPCPRCGRLLKQPGLCADCRRTPPPFSWARAAGPYTGPLRQAIHRFKYAGYRHLAFPLAYLLNLALEQARFGLKDGLPSFDLLVPVPLHPNRLAQRRFNQAALLATELANLRRLPFAVDALLRTRETLPQVGLGREERLHNLVGAFRVGQGTAIRNRALLLVDDTFTTGATAGECSRVLLEAGARAVYVVTIATGLPANKYLP